ncbi:hypothetical protein TrRE_jg13064 [Triparma retinervis]|uniref:Uncharacterized protein n=1 Tax=Triparma retinervis TaxID=2557542 RepID=A0A9W7G6D2_9STRA|nr:hypothetical protein TrRE_jg13064 [Triparma retinervis]
MARVKFAEGTKPGAKQSRTKSSTKSGRKSKSNINRYFEKSGRTKIPPEPTKRSEKSGPKTVSPGSPFVEKRGLGKSRRGGGLKGSNLDFDDEQREEQPGTPKLCLCVDFRTDSGAGGGDFGGLSGGFSGSSTEQDSQSAAFRLLMGEVLESGVKRGVLGKGNFIVGARGMEESSEFRKDKGGVATGRGGVTDNDFDYKAHLTIYIPDYNLDKSAKPASSEPFVSLCLKTMTGGSSTVKKVKIVVVRCGDSSTFSTRGANKGVEDLVRSVQSAGNANLSLEIVTANTPAAVSHILGIINTMYVPELKTKLMLPPIDGDSCEFKLDLHPTVLPEYEVGTLATSRFLRQESLGDLVIKSRVGLEAIDVSLFFGFPLVGVPGGEGEMERKGMEALGSCVAQWLMKEKCGLLLKTKAKNPVTHMFEFYVLLPSQSGKSFLLNQVTDRSLFMGGIVASGDSDKNVETAEGKAYEGYISEAMGQYDEAPLNPLFLDGSVEEVEVKKGGAGEEGEGGEEESESESESEEEVVEEEEEEEDCGDDDDSDATKEYPATVVDMDVVETAVLPQEPTEKTTKLQQQPTAMDLDGDKIEGAEEDIEEAEVVVEAEEVIIEAEVVNSHQPSKYSSHLVSSSRYVPDGLVYLLSPCDPLFLLLPSLTRLLDKFSPYDQLVSDLGGCLQGLGRLVTPSLLLRVCAVSDCMGDDMLLYKLDPGKVMSWLGGKRERVRRLLERREGEGEGRNRATDKQSLADGFNMGGAAQSGEGEGDGEGGEIGGGGKEQKTPLGEYAAANICEYLDPYWSGKFLAHVGLAGDILHERKSSVKRKAAWDKGRDEESDKIMTYTMGEATGKNGEEGKKEEERKRKERDSKKQKDLKKASKGMKSLASFFGGGKKK